MTNFGALAILALPGVRLESDLRILIALETITPDAAGFRHIGMQLLAQKARVPYDTARKSVARLTAAKLIFYVPGSGRGHVTTWRILFSLDRPKVSAQDGHLSDAQRCPPEPVKVTTEASKGDRQNSVTSPNENTGLNTSGLNQSGLLSEAEAVNGPVEVRSPRSRRSATPRRSKVRERNAQRNRQLNALEASMTSEERQNLGMRPREIADVQSHTRRCRTCNGLLGPDDEEFCIWCPGNPSPWSSLPPTGTGGPGGW